MRFLLAYILSLICISANADSISLLNDLVSRGNRAYDLSQRTRIRQCADSAMSILVAGDIPTADAIDLSASIYKLYGNYHYENCALDSAEFYYDKAQNIIDNNPNISFKALTKLLVLRDRAQLYYRMEDYLKAADIMSTVDDIIEYDTPYDLGSDDWLLTKLSYAMCLARVRDFATASEIAGYARDVAKDKHGLAYARADRMYAKIQMLAQADVAGALKAYKNFFNTQKDYALDNFGKMTAHERSEYWQSLRPFIADCYQLEGIDPGFLYNVVLFSKGLLLQLSSLSGDDRASASALRTLSCNWPDIQKRLKPGDVAIEFVQYTKGGTERMAALVLKPKGVPVFVPLPPPSYILDLGGKDMLSTDRRNKDKLYNNVDLHTLLWPTDLLSSIADAKRVFFAPDGYLHRIPIEYMPPVRDRQLFRLTSTRRLLDKPTALVASAPTLFFGGVNYDIDKAPDAPAQNDAVAYGNYLGKSFPRINDCANEANAIFKFRNNAADSLVSGAMASESAFASLAQDYESILISTHGDFCSRSSVPTDLKVTDDDAAMSCNIIAFAGVNSHLRDQHFDAANRRDGLLSAKELSEINLRRCKLFTVSACQSALGSISPDGVFGLQRGLKNAGVDVMVLSLWNVNANATATLMKSFFANLNDGLGIRAAFAKARADLLSASAVQADSEPKYRFDAATMSMRPVKSTEQPTYNSPQYTDAFILIDALD